MAGLPILSVIARYRLSRKSLTPQETLKFLLGHASQTRFGRKYGFADMIAQDDVYKSFSGTIPLTDYSSWLSFLGPQYQFDSGHPSILVNEAWPERIRHFCLSSGTTTGKTKYIPYSAMMAKLNRKAAIDLLFKLILEDPGFNPLRRRTLYMSGSTALAPDKEGVIAGDMSGLTKYLAPGFISWMTLPPNRVSSLEPWSVRLPELVAFSISASNTIGMISGIPVWILTFLQEVRRVSGKEIPEVFPGLRYLIHGGMPLGPYETPLRNLLGENIRFVDVYAASETGITAIGISSDKGLDFLQHYGVFYEFEADDGTVHPSWELQVGMSYNLLVSSCSGLWRYRIGDRVRVTHTCPVRIDTVFRAQTTTSFDEKVTEEQVILAVKANIPKLTDFSMGPCLKEKRHVWFFLLDGHPDQGIEDIDRTLRQLNQDYDDYRGDGRIHKPRAVNLSSRSEFLELIGREEGGQRKFPRLLSPEEVEELLNHSFPSKPTPEGP